MRYCDINDCGLWHHGHGYCLRHLRIWRRYGDAEHPTRRLNGTGGDKNGYLVYRHEGKTKYVHRVIMEQHLGRELERHETVHHLNADKRDNRVENLELWTSRHPHGARVSDHVAWAKEILRTHEPEALNDNGGQQHE